MQVTSSQGLINQAPTSHAAFNFSVRTSIPVSVTLCLYKGNEYHSQLNSKSFDRSTRFSAVIPNDITSIRAYVGSKMGALWEDISSKNERSLEVKNLGYGNYSVYCHDFELYSALEQKLG